MMNNTATAQETKWYNKTPFIIFACVAFFPVGIFLLWKSSSVKTVWRVVLTVIFAFYGLLLTVATFAPDTPEMKAKQLRDDSLAHISKARDENIESEKKQKEADKAAQSKEPRIINSIDELAKRFNEFAVNGKLDFRMNDVKIEQGEVKNTFRYMFNDNIGFIGAVNKSDNSISSLSMIGTGDGTAVSGANIIIMMVSIIAVTDPSIQPDNRADILKRLGMFDKSKKITDMEGHVIQNGIKYSIASSPAMGLWFSAERPD
jgi:hypothetical protein